MEDGGNTDIGLEAGSLQSYVHHSADVFFECFDKEELAMAISNASTRQVQIGVNVISQGHQPEKSILYVVKHGEFVATHGEKTRNLIPGEAFDQGSALWGRAYTETVVANTSDAELWELELKPTMEQNCQAKFRELSFESGVYLTLVGIVLCICVACVGLLKDADTILRCILGCYVFELLCLVYEYSLCAVSNLAFEGSSSPRLSVLYRINYGLLPVMPVLAFPRILWIMQQRSFMSLGVLVCFGVNAFLCCGFLLVDWLMWCAGKTPALKPVIKTTSHGPRFAYAIPYKGLPFLVVVLPPVLVLLQCLIISVVAVVRGQGVAMLLGFLTAFLLPWAR